MPYGKTAIFAGILKINMRKKIILTVKLSVLFLLLVFSLENIKKAYPLPYPHFNQMLVEREGFKDIMGILFGFRGTAADIVWIDFIQYLGGGILPDEDASRSHDLIKYFSQRIIRIDPFHRSAVLYGAGMLAWFKSIDRPQEAIELLEEGIKNNPDYWPYQTYMAAIVYKKDMDDEASLAVIEDAVRRQGCPMMVKSMLANIYKKKKEYQKAMRVWDRVLLDENSYYHGHAIKQIEILRGIVRREG